MKLYGIIIIMLQIAVVLGCAPAFTGWVKMLKCWSQGRTSAGLFQPYRDIAKLFTKDVLLADNASWIFRFTPYLLFGTVVLAGAIIPMLSILPTAYIADVIVLVALFTIGRFFTALAGMDMGTAFGGMGSSREMTIASLAEPAMLMAIFTVSLATRSTSLSHMVQAIYSGTTVLRPSLGFAFITFILIALAETGRIPVDNPATHLELTMIHEAMILEYSGRHLALIEWASMMKLFLFVMIGIATFAPWGIAESADLITIAAAFIIMVAKLAFTGICLVMIVQRRIFVLVNLFAWQGVFLSLNTAIVGFVAEKHHLYISSVLTLGLKVILLPYILHVLIRRLKLHREVEIVVNIPMTMLMGIALVIFSYHLTAPVRELSTLVTRSTLAVALATVMIGLLMMITRKHAVTQIIGFLAMENGLFFAATSATYGMPLVVELGVALDILIAAFIFGIFFFHIRTTFDSLDVEQMARLKEED